MDAARRLVDEAKGGRILQGGMRQLTNICKRWQRMLKDLASRPVLCVTPSAPTARRRLASGWE